MFEELLMHKVIIKHQLCNLSLLSNFAVHKEALMCPNMNRKDVHHIDTLCVIYDDIKRCVNASKEALCQPKSYPALDRGNECVSMQHAAAREAFRLLIGRQSEIGGCCQIIVVFFKKKTTL